VDVNDPQIKNILQSYGGGSIGLEGFAGFNNPSVDFASEQKEEHHHHQQQKQDEEEDDEEEALRRAKELSMAFEEEEK